MKTAGPLDICRENRLDELDRRENRSETNIESTFALLPDLKIRIETLEAIANFFFFFCQSPVGSFFFFFFCFSFF